MRTHGLGFSKGTVACFKKKKIMWSRLEVGKQVKR